MTTHLKNAIKMINEIVQKHCYSLCIARKHLRNSFLFCLFPTFTFVNLIWCCRHYTFIFYLSLSFSLLHSSDLLLFACCLKRCLNILVSKTISSLSSPWSLSIVALNTMPFFFLHTHLASSFMSNQKTKQFFNFFSSLMAITMGFQDLGSDLRILFTKSLVG